MPLSGPKPSSKTNKQHTSSPTAFSSANIHQNSHKIHSTATTKPQHSSNWKGKWGTPTTYSYSASLIKLKIQLLAIAF